MWREYLLCIIILPGFVHNHQKVRKQKQSGKRTHRKA